MVYNMLGVWEWLLWDIRSHALDVLKFAFIGKTSGFMKAIWWEYIIRFYSPVYFYLEFILFFLFYPSYLLLAKKVALYRYFFCYCVSEYSSKVTTCNCWHFQTYDSCVESLAWFFWWYRLVAACSWNASSTGWNFKILGIAFWHKVPILL